jgi:hypothetical protein
MTIEEQFSERLAQVDAEIAASGFQNYKQNFLARVSGPPHQPNRTFKNDRAAEQELKRKIRRGAITMRHRSVDVRPTWKYKPANTIQRAEPTAWKFRKADRVIYHEAPAKTWHFCACGKTATRFIPEKLDSKVWVCADCFTRFTLKSPTSRRVLPSHTEGSSAEYASE